MSKQTSRSPLIDAVELIGHQIALSSHLYEYMGYLQKEQEADPLEERNIEIEDVQEMINKVTQARRNLMSAIEEQYDTNYHYWCASKHAIGAFSLACELHQSYAKDPDLSTRYYNFMIESQKTLYVVLSKWLGLDEVVVCGRCISDKLEEKSELPPSLKA